MQKFILNNTPEKYRVKSILLTFLLLLLIFEAGAQSSGEISYYYKGEKIYLPVSYDRVLVEVKQGRSVNLIRKSIARLMVVAEDSIEPTGLPNQVIMKLGNNAQKLKAKESLSKLDALPEILFSRPFFKSSSGKYNSYGKEFIVKLKAGTPFPQVQKLMEATGCRLVRNYPFREDIFIIAAGVKAGYDGMAMASYFYETGYFEYAEPEMYVSDALETAPNDPSYNKQWAHKNTGSPAQFNGTPGVDMKIQEAWAFTMGSSSIKIGIIDDGVDLTHPDLQANILQGFNGATLTANPGDGAPLTSINAHGTNCAGIIAAIANNGIGLAGVAPGCKIIPAVIFNGSNYLGNVAAAACFDYVRLQGADVISNSWGGGSPSNMMDDAISRAVTLGRDGKGCLVFASSGNDNAEVHFPAAYPQVIAVGGISMCNERKSPVSCDGETRWGANYGPGLDVVAPSVKIFSTDIQGTGGYNTNAGTGGNYYPRFGGTSSSCPNAAGVMALILSYRPGLTAAEAKRILYLSCNKMPLYTYGADPAFPDQQYGSWNNETGYGSVNAHAALQLLAGCNTTGLPAPTVIDGPAGACRNSINQVFSVAPVEGATSYLWTLPTGATGSSSTNSISVNFDGSYLTGNICVSALNDCVQSSAYCRQVIYLPGKLSIPAGITGPVSAVCAGSTQTWSCSVVSGATTYLWTVPPDAIINSGQGTNTISVTLPPNFASGKVTVAAVNACTTSTARSLTIAAKPVMPSAITGPAAICPLETGLVYSVIALPGLTYNWVVPNGAAITSGQGTASITVNWGSIAGSVKVSAENICGASAFRSLMVGFTSCVPLITSANTPR